MRRFHSYGPVDARQHFCVPREALIQQCLTALIGDPNTGGHYFTIWAPRQTGKTWIMRQVVNNFQAEYGDEFLIGSLSMQGMILEDHDPPEKFLEYIPRRLSQDFKLAIPPLENWDAWTGLFLKTTGLFERPLILFIDEFDSLPKALIDRLVTLFRDMYLNRDQYLLHGLALIGVRAVLGIESLRGSPFNIQRSLHIPNLTREEVQSLYQQYQNESGQVVAPEVVEAVYAATNGQPGLVGWFGELLTEKYNPGQEYAIDSETWKMAWHKARFNEPNNTVLNLIAKARMPEYQGFLLELFTHADIPFLFHDPLHNYLYLHGILGTETVRQENGELLEICRFASPFVQHCLYDALGRELVGDTTPILALESLDMLADVFAGDTLNLPALLQRYTAYLIRLKAKDINPWKEPPRRETDLHLTEAVGHFHLYAWLQQAIGRRCVVSPEFPTGNGKVDLHLKCGAKRGIIEVKSFVNAYQLNDDKTQAARYARQLGFVAVTLVTFVPVEDDAVLAQLSGEQVFEGVRVNVVAIGWV